MDVDWWPTPVFRRPGAPRRLRGLPVYYDFRWLDVFETGRAQFRNGKVLAETVIQECPSGLKPALMLTRDADAQQGFLATDSLFLFVINVDEYRRTTGNAALSYLAKHLNVGAAQIGEFTDLSTLGSAEEVRSLLARHLEVEQVAAWLNDDEGRRRRVAELVDFDAAEPATVQQALDALNALGTLDAGDLARLISFTVRVTEGDNRVELMRSATADEPGRTVASLVLGERVSSRLEDARRVIREYEDLLAAPATSETDMQRFLTRNPLLFGLQYAHIRPQQNTPSGTLDFLLERFDGYHDLVELKGPSDELIPVKRTDRRGSPSPHRYRLGKALAQALAQAMAYRDRLTRHHDAANEFFGIKNARDPWLFIIVGRADQLEEDQRLVLKELNGSLHRAEILPYDVLGRRARGVLDNLEAFLDESDGEI